VNDCNRVIAFGQRFFPHLGVQSSPFLIEMSVFGFRVVDWDAQESQNVILRTNERVANFYSLRLVKRPSIKLCLGKA